MLRCPEHSSSRGWRVQNSPVSERFSLRRRLGVFKTLQFGTFQSQVELAHFRFRPFSLGTSNASARTLQFQAFSVSASEQIQMLLDGS
ncbi:hypothetical protein R1flu_021235 [Riccia fluitans]|uniref:Uncharacterized protein n=1 Tax=Riccia fluitans TaxID=41844 RepID=A0ABD1ZPX6_9MARC